MFELTKDQKELQLRARTFAEAELTGRAAEIDETQEYPWDIVEKLAKANIYGQWTGEKLFRNTDGPQPAGDACLWKWAEVRGLAQKAIHGARLRDLEGAAIPQTGPQEPVVRLFPGPLDRGRGG